MDTTIKEIDYVKMLKDLIYERFKTPYEEKINKNGIINSLSRVKINGVLLVDILNEGYKFSETNLPLKELVYLVLHNEFGERPKCTQCNTEYSKFRNIKDGYAKTCGIECIIEYSKNRKNEIVDTIKSNLIKSESKTETETFTGNELDELKKFNLNGKQSFNINTLKESTPYDPNNITRSGVEVKLYDILCENIIDTIITYNPKFAFKNKNWDLDILLISSVGKILGIDVHGPYYHSTHSMRNRKNKYIHKEKNIEFIKKGRRLIQIISNEIIDVTKRNGNNEKFHIINKKLKIILKIISRILNLTNILKQKNKLLSEEEQIYLKDNFYIDEINIHNSRYKINYRYWKRDFTKQIYAAVNSDIEELYTSFTENNFKMMIEDPSYSCISLMLEGYRTSGDKNCKYKPFATAQYKIINNCAYIERFYNIEQVITLDESTLSLISKELKTKFKLDDVFCKINLDFENFDDHIFRDKLGSVIDLKTLERLDPIESIYHFNYLNEYSYSKIYHSQKEGDFSYIIEKPSFDKNGIDRNIELITIHNKDMISGKNCGNYLAVFNSGFGLARVIR